MLKIHSALRKITDMKQLKVCKWQGTEAREEIWGCETIFGLQVTFFFLAANVLNSDEIRNSKFAWQSAEQSLLLKMSASNHTLYFSESSRGVPLNISKTYKTSDLSKFRGNLFIYFFVGINNFSLRKIASNSDKRVFRSCGTSHSKGVKGGSL